MSFYICNNIFFKIKLSRGFFKYYILGILVFKRLNTYFATIDIHNPNQSFNTKDIDLDIERLILDYAKNKGVQSLFSVAHQNRIAFLATELYDTGGHTECLKNVIASLHGEYDIALFCSKYFSTEKKAPLKLSYIKKRSVLFDGIEFNGIAFKDSALSLFYKIYAYAPKVLFVYMHMDDSLGVAVLALLKKYTDIKIFYFNHGAHYPALGFSFADASLECMPSTQYLTEQKREFNKCIRVVLPSSLQEENPSFSDDEIQLKRKELGVRNGNLCTVSGGALYKFFEGDKSSYFEFIKNILQQVPNLQHVFMSNITKSAMRKVKNIFKDDPEAFSRLIFEPLSIEYQLVFKMADVFVDSFPVSAALTQIDLMRLKVPSVVKINRDDTKISFHEYMPENYAYMSENLDGLEKMLLKLLGSKNLRKEVAEQNYVHYLNFYEGRAVRKCYKNIIENADNLESLLFKSISKEADHD